MKQAKLTVLTSRECKDVAFKDATAKELAKDANVYSAHNIDLYQVVINSWLCLIEDYTSTEVACRFSDIIRYDGLIPVIAACSGIADDILQSEDPLRWVNRFRFDRPHLDDEEVACVVGEALKGLLDFGNNPEKLRATLQTLRYPKRFSPDGADLLNSRALKAWKTGQRIMKGQNHIELPQYLVRKVRSILMDFDRECSLIKENRTSITGYYPDSLLRGYVPNGACVDAKRTDYSAKASILYKYLGFAGSPLYPVRVPERIRPSTFRKVKIVCVPKTYKTPRLIAEEYVVNQVYWHGLRETILPVLKRYFGDYIDLNDQTLSRDLCRNLQYATVDLTAASDSITCSHVASFLPNLWRLIDPFRAIYTTEGLLLETALTSGNGMTFLVESVVFLAVALAATETYSLFAEEECLPPRVYGDDVIIDARVYSLFVEFCTALHFQVNEAKSFAQPSPYRESCGAEWYVGCDGPYDGAWSMETAYFERKPLYNHSVEEIVLILAELQRKLYLQGHTSAADWLREYILRLDKRVNSVDPQLFDPSLFLGTPTTFRAVARLERGLTPVGLAGDRIEGSSTDGSVRYKLYTYKPKVKRITPDGSYDRDMVLYSTYLQHGPSYASKLDKLLKVSQRRVDEWILPDDLSGRNSLV